MIRTARQRVADLDVMVVDDDPTVLRLAERRARASGISTRMCDSAEAALEWLRTHHVRLLLVDLRMAPTDGIQLLTALQEEGLLQGTGRIVCTSVMPNKEVRAKARQLGAAILLKERMLESGGIERLLNDDGAEFAD